MVAVQIETILDLCPGSVICRRGATLCGCVATRAQCFAAAKKPRADSAVVCCAHATSVVARQDGSRSPAAVNASQTHSIDGRRLAKEDGVASMTWPCVRIYQQPRETLCLDFFAR